MRCQWIFFRQEQPVSRSCLKTIWALLYVPLSPVSSWSLIFAYNFNRKYYDDCAQILMEHILATCKPGSSMGFSTLDPLVTSVRIEDGKFDRNGSGASKKQDTFFSRATRMLQGEPADDEVDSDDNNEHDQKATNKKIKSVNSPARSDASAGAAEMLSSAAATLVEGAIPVRDLPNHLLSEPASMCPSEVSSQAGDLEPSIHQYRPEEHDESTNLVDTHQEELRCVIAVIRHGDRTPKQKLKATMKEPLILKYFHDHTDDCKKELKVKAKAPMTEFLETVKNTLAELDKRNSDKDHTLKYQLRHMRDILEKWKIAGLNRKLQIKPKKFEEYVEEATGKTKTRCKSVQLVFKYGGNLTRLGENQALRLGKNPPFVARMFCCTASSMVLWPNFLLFVQQAEDFDLSFILIKAEVESCVFIQRFAMISRLRLVTRDAS